MRVEIEATERMLLEKAEERLLLAVLQRMMKKRQEMIQALRNKIDRYEKQRAQERIAYHKMSAFRKWLAGKTPEHHLAVENLVYIKQPMEEIERLTDELARLKRIEEMVREKARVIYIPASCSRELAHYYAEGGEGDE